MPKRRLQSSTKAIALMCLGMVFISVMDACVKYLATVEQLPVIQIVWLRYVVHMLVTLALLSLLHTPRYVLGLVKSNRPRLQILRSVFMVCSTLANFFALKYLQLDQTIVIYFLSPLVLAALAGSLLGEYIGWHRVTAIMIGFLGVMLVIQPGLGTIHPAAFLSVLSMTLYSLYVITTRFLAPYDHSDVTQFFSPLAALVLVAPFALADWQMPQGALTWLVIFLLGCGGGLGHWLIILAHRHTPAPVLAPFIYTALISHILLGWLIFSDVPNIWTLLGGSVVVGSGLYLLWREQVTGQP